MKKITGMGAFSSNVKTQTQLTNGIKHILDLTQAHIDQALNGGKLIPPRAGLKGTNPVQSFAENIVDKK